MCAIIYMCIYPIFFISRSLTVHFLSFTSVKRERLKSISWVHCFFSLLLWRWRIHCSDTFMKILFGDKTSHGTIKPKMVFGASTIKEGSASSMFVTHKTPLSSVQNADQEGSIWEIKYSSLSLRAGIRDWFQGNNSPYSILSKIQWLCSFIHALFFLQIMVL